MPESRLRSAILPQLLPVIDGTRASGEGLLLAQPVSGGAWTCCRVSDAESSPALTALLPRSHKDTARRIGDTQLRASRAVLRYRSETCCDCEISFSHIPLTGALESGEDCHKHDAFITLLPSWLLVQEIGGLRLFSL